ncbi:MAG TPA: DUF3572 family protein [Devosia sp.]|nr:DUF3572 family protein [Devosia sp.]
MALKQPQPSLIELAGLCLDYLAQNPDKLAEFMSIAGLSPDGLRQAVGSRSFALGLLDYVVGNEDVLLAVSQSAAIRPETVMQVWAKHNPAG